MKYILTEEEFDKIKNQEKFNKEEFKSKILDSVYNDIASFFKDLIDGGALKNEWNDRYSIGGPKTIDDCYVQIYNYKKSIKKLQEDIKNTLNKL